MSARTRFRRTERIRMANRFRWLPVRGAWLLSFVVMSFWGSCLEAAAARLEPLAVIRPEKNGVAIDHRANPSGVHVRIADEGWRSYTLTHEGHGVFRVNGLTSHDLDFRQIRAGANAVLSESNRVRVEGAGLVLWSEDLGQEAVAFGMVGSPTAVGASAVFFSDGKALVLRETFLGGEVARIVPENGLTAADVTADQSRAVTVGAGMVEVWDVNSGEALQRFEIGEPSMETIALSKIIFGGRRVVLASEDSFLEVWDLISGTRVSQYRSGSPILSLDVANDGSIALISHSNGRVIVYNLTDGSSENILHFVEGDGVLQGASLSPLTEGELNTLWTRNDRGEIQHWTVNGVLLGTIDATEIPLWAETVVVAPDLSRVAVRDRFSERHFVYDLASGLREVIEVDHVRFLAEQRYAGWSEREFGVWRYDQAAPSLVWRSEYDETISPDINDETVEVSFNREGKELVQTLRLVDGMLLKEESVVAESNPVSIPGRLSFPTTTEVYGQLTVIKEEANEDRIEQTVSMALIDSATGEERVSLEGTLLRLSRENTLPNETVPIWVESRVKVAMSWDGRYVAAGVDGNARVWDVATGRLLLSKEEPMARFNHVVFNRSGDQVSLQFIAIDGGQRLHSVWQLDATPRALIDERFEGRVDVKLLEESIELELSSNEHGDSVRVYDAVTGAFVEERETGPTSWSVSVRGAEPYRMRVRVVQETELEGEVEWKMAVDLRPGRSGSRWIGTLQGIVTARFPLIGDGDVKRVARPSFRGVWLEEDNLYMVGIGSTVTLWNYETAERIGSANLESLGRAVQPDVIGWRAIPSQVSVDKKRVLVRLEGVVEDSNTESGVRVAAVRNATMTAGGEVYLLPSGGRELLFDDRFTRVLVSSATDPARLDLWEVKTSTRIASIASGLELSIGIESGRGVNPLPLLGHQFLDDGERLLTVSADGIGIWDFSHLLPGLAIRRGTDDISLVWESAFVRDGDRLQASDSIVAPTWVDLDPGEASVLSLDVVDRPFQMFRWIRE